MHRRFGIMCAAVTSYCTPVRLRVVNVLKQWVEKHFYDFRTSQVAGGAKHNVTQESSNLLKMLLSFTKEVITQDKKMANACQPIIKAIKRQVKGDPLDNFMVRCMVVDSPCFFMTLCCLFNVLTRP